MHMGRQLVAWLVLAAVAWTLPARADDKKPETPKGMAGYWLGMLKAGPLSLRLLIDLKGSDDKLSATLDSPDEGLQNLALSAVKVEGSKFSFTLKVSGAAYEGKLNEARTEIAGQWKQRGQETPLSFKRLDKKPEFAKPQEPKRPYPYRDEEVVVENKKDKLKLAGTLTLPKGDGPFPAAILLTGSGPQDRNESLLGHKPFLVLADYLTRQGIAVLRCDDRGVGKSTGKFLGSTGADFAEDARSQVAFLRGRKEIDRQRIGLVGHSEGGIVAPLVAADDKDIAYIVLLAGTALPGADISTAQVHWLLKAAKMDDKKIEQKLIVQRRLMNVFKTEDDDDKTAKALEAIIDEEIASLNALEKALGAAQKKHLFAGQLNKASYAWTRFFVRHDPRPTLAKVTCPVLALIGEKDFQVSAKDNLPEFEKALRNGASKDYLVRELKGLNHLFQTAKTGGIEEYAKIQETFAPAALELVGGWINERVGKTK